MTLTDVSTTRGRLRASAAAVALTSGLLLGGHAVAPAQSTMPDPQQAVSQVQQSSTQLSSQLQLPGLPAQSSAQSSNLDLTSSQNKDLHLTIQRLIMTALGVVGFPIAAATVTLLLPFHVLLSSCSAINPNHCG